MKIAYIIPSLANTGPQIVVMDLCKELVMGGHECKVFYFDDIVELEMPCPVEKIGFTSKFDFSRWDVVHSHMLRPDLWVWLRKPWFGIKAVEFISTLHNPISYKAFRTYFSILFSTIGSLSWAIALMRFGRIVVLNSDTQQRLPVFLRRKTTVIPNGRDITVSKKISDEQHASVISKLRERYRVVGVVCGMYRRKGIEQIIHALVDLPEYCFVGVGDGPQLDEWKALAKSLNVDGICYWVGYTPKAAEYYSAFDVFVLPSRSEGFPLAMIEAAAYGLPLILSDIPIFRSIAENRTNILLVKLDSPMELAVAIHYTYEHRVNFGKLSRAYYEQELTAKSMAQKYCLTYTNRMKFGI